MVTKAGVTQTTWSMKGQSMHLSRLCLRRTNGLFLSATGGVSTMALRVATRAAITTSAITTSRVGNARKSFMKENHNTMY
jgi:NADPH:quinone reductase-like Zn-dependent oxidoreductase